MVFGGFGQLVGHFNRIKGRLKNRMPDSGFKLFAHTKYTHFHAVNAFDVLFACHHNACVTFLSCVIFILVNVYLESFFF